MTQKRFTMHRREAIKILGAASAASVIGAACKTSSKPAQPGTGDDATAAQGALPKAQIDERAPMSRLMPTIFLAHGSPMLLDNERWVGELKAWAGALPRPKSVLMLSAHWEARPITISATKTIPLYYDFYGFPDRYYEVTYPAPGAPELANRIVELLSPTQMVLRDELRGLDHGAYVPMKAMYPDADVPVLQLSLPTMSAPDLFSLGEQLAPLRSEGVLIIGSGFLTHNLGFRHAGEGIATWAQEFDTWSAEVLARRDSDALLKYRAKAPGVRLALPTHEHFVPVITAMGAAMEPGAPVTFPITGFMGGHMTRRSVQFG